MEIMFKHLLFLLGLMLILSQASAYIYMLSPTEAVLESGQTVDLGSAQAGETVEVIISNNTGRGAENWSQAVVPEENLPTGWSAANSAIGEETFVVRVLIPVDAAQNIYNFRLTAKGGSLGVNDESINARLAVETGLITASIERQNPTEAVYVESPVYYKLILNNSSIAEHTVMLDSVLPRQWFGSREFTVSARDIAEYDFTVMPLVYGKKDFSFTVSSSLNNLQVGSFNSALEVLPTLEGKYSQALYGFPFFTISLLPYYIINSFISLILP